MAMLALRNWGVDSRNYSSTARLTGTSLFVIFFLLGIVLLSLIDLIRIYEYFSSVSLVTNNPRILFSLIYFGFVLLGLNIAYYGRLKLQSGNLIIINICRGVYFGIVIGLLFEIVSQLALANIISRHSPITFHQYLASYVKHNTNYYLINFIILIVVLAIRKKWLSYKMNVHRKTGDTSNNLGASQMASTQDITQYGLRVKSGSLIGKDSLGYIRSQTLCDRLILAYRGSGKTSSVLIPFILDNLSVNKLITDIKGELSAVTARRAIDAGRAVFIIDPFNVLKSLGIQIKTHSLNPLAYINQHDETEKDRMIASLATALCSSDHGTRSETEAHFNENAQIILEGVLDFFVSENFGQPDKLNLVELHDWWLDLVSDPEEEILTRMRVNSHKARAAAAQMSVSGKDESGSMKTTIYRQLQWLRSENVRNIFTKDEIDLNAFVTGECDIYVVLPEDMIGAFSRLVRVIMALVKVKLIQTSPSNLKQHYCFVLDELGQFGYSPDVEQVINTMRSRGVKVWASFQTIGQVEKYVDDAIFKGMPIKQFLGCDDLKTLEWIQKLGDKTTVLTENISRNINHSLKSKQASTSESISLSEHATDLIHFSDIREMNDNEQFVFIRGCRPIRCQKAYYFNEPIYHGRFDLNPLENR